MLMIPLVVMRLLLLVTSPASARLDAQIVIAGVSGARFLVPTRVTRLLRKVPSVQTDVRRGE